MSASKRRSARSCRQSLANSTAARVRSLNSANLLSNFSSRAMPSAAEPAKPAKTLPLLILRTLRAPCLTMVLSRVTWPSPAIASFPSRRTARIVVERTFIWPLSLPDPRHNGFRYEPLDGGERALGHHPPPLPLAKPLVMLSLPIVMLSRPIVMLSRLIVMLSLSKHGRKGPPGDVRRLKVGGVTILQVSDDGAERCFAGELDRRQSQHLARGVDARHRAARRRLHVAFCAGNLPREV